MRRRRLTGKNRVPGRWLSLLLACVLLLQSMFPAFAGTDEKENCQIGELQVCTDAGEQKQVPAALCQDGEDQVILMEPEYIADIAGLTLEQEDGDVLFSRGNYAVLIDPDTGDVRIGLIMGEEKNYFSRMMNRDSENSLAGEFGSVGDTVRSAWQLYPEENFCLEEVRRLEDGGEEKLFLPLEKVLYLMNVQWHCENNCVYVYSPVETLWNLVGELGTLAEARPAFYEVIGTTAGDQLSSSFMYGVLAAGDELKSWMFVPVVGESVLRREDMEQALLTLAKPCTNITEGLRSDAESAASDFIGDYASYVNKVTNLAGTTDSAKLLGKVFSSWQKLPEIPASVKNGLLTAKTLGALVNARATAARYQDWTEGYREELRELSSLEDEDYPEYSEALNRVAESLYSECGNLAGNMAYETFWAAMGVAGDEIQNLTPVGWLFSGYSGITTVLSLVPVIGRTFDSAEHATDAMRLCDLVVILYARYCDVIEEKNGQPDSTADLAEIRRWGKYLASASAHGCDSLYSALRLMLLNKLGADALESEIRAYTIKGTDMNALAQKMVLNQTFVFRFQETEQFDNALILNDGFTNLYNAKEGSRREEIPPEYVILAAENNGGNFVEYQGDLYYWKYRAESVADRGLFMYFYTLSGVENQLVCRHADGSEEVLLTAQGSGPIFLMKGRIYLQQDDSTLFSVKTDGSDRVDHGDFQPWAADEASGTLLGTSYERNGICCLDAETLTIEQVTGQSAVFCDVIEGVCYYTVADTDVPGFTLYRISPDGGQITEIDHVSKAVGEALGLDICQLARLGDRLYYSYGFYAGTGGFFQSGGINSVKTDGTEPEVCVEYGSLAAEEFCVKEEDGKKLLYYIGDAMNVNGSYIGFWDDYPYSGCNVMDLNRDLNSRETAPSTFELSRPGSFICDDGRILSLKKNSTTYQELIPKEVCAQFGFIDQPQGQEDSLAIISRLDLVGGDLYFTVDWGLRDKETDVGWRPAYQRQKSTVYTMKSGGTELTELYSY